MWEPQMFCCCGVRQGSILIASFVLLCCLVDIGSAVLGLPRNIFIADYHEGCRERDQMVMDEEMCQKIAARNQMTKSVFVSVRMATNVILIVVSSMLIHGVRKGRPCLLIPFMIVHVMAIVSLILATIIQLVTLVTDNVADFIVLLVIGPIGVCILVYLLFVIRASYLETKRSKIQAYTEFHDEDGISYGMSERPSYLLIGCFKEQTRPGLAHGELTYQ
ncbi:uncharacterized protein LOC135212667 [Macrobrachium nipponense]|uniref:uncharacterized protein LOC135212667 n=1 Tax=Macrobrachium nipponense TaxID=159736 RepID=UPI0030C8B7B2